MSCCFVILTQCGQLCGARGSGAFGSASASDVGERGEVQERLRLRLMLCRTQSAACQSQLSKRNSDTRRTKVINHFLFSPPLYKIYIYIMLYVHIYEMKIQMRFALQTFVQLPLSLSHSLTRSSTQQFCSGCCSRSVRVWLVGLSVSQSVGFAECFVCLNDGMSLHQIEGQQIHSHTHLHTRTLTHASHSRLGTFSMMVFWHLCQAQPLECYQSEKELSK